MRCHVIGGRGGVLGPDLEKVHRRLRPGFLHRWLQEPGFADRDARAPCGSERPASLTRWFYRERKKER
jgi:hypothetical protein